MSPNGTDPTALELAIRFYRWSLAEARREAAQDFPLLRTVRDHNAYRAVRLIAPHMASERTKWLTALVKRFSSDAMGACGESIGQREKVLIQLYLGDRIIIEPEPEEQRVADLRHAGKFTPARRKDLKKALRPRLDFLGEFEDVFGEWRFRTQVEGWTVVTDIDCGGRRDLVYSHRIVSDKQPLFFDNINLERWLGVSSTTSWSDLQPDDVSATVDSVCRLCKHFLDAAPALLRNLPA